MTNNENNSNLHTRSTAGNGILGEGAEKYLRDSANIEDLPGDDDQEVVDDTEEDDIDEVDYELDVDDVETETADTDAAIDGEEDEDYINKDEAKRDLKERGLRP